MRDSSSMVFIANGNDSVYIVRQLVSLAHPVRRILESQESGPLNKAASKAGPLVRDAREDDLPAIQKIYAHHVLHGRASFEGVRPD